MFVLSFLSLLCLWTKPQFDRFLYIFLFKPDELSHRLSFSHVTKVQIIYPSPAINKLIWIEVIFDLSAGRQDFGSHGVDQWERGERWSDGSCRRGRGREERPRNPVSLPPLSIPEVRDHLDTQTQIQQIHVWFYKHGWKMSWSLVISNGFTTTNISNSGLSLCINLDKNIQQYHNYRCWKVSWNSGLSLLNHLVKNVERFEVLLKRCLKKVVSHFAVILLNISSGFTLRSD